MKTKLKRLTNEYIAKNSDIKFGLLSRNQYVEVLKKIVLPIKNKKLRKKIDELKPGRTPQISFFNLMEFLGKEYPGLKFAYSDKEEFPQHSMIYQENDWNHKLFIFSCDFLPQLRVDFPKLERLMVKCISTMYHRLGFEGLCQGGRFYSEEWIKDGLDDNIAQAKPISDKDHIYHEGLKRCRADYAAKDKLYTDKMLKMVNLKKLEKDLDQLEVPKHYKHVQQLMKDMIDISKNDKTITDYNNIACKRHFDEEGNDPNEEMPALFEESFLFVWGGPIGEDDYVQHEVEHSANDTSGNFGYTAYHSESDIDVNTLDDLTDINTKDSKFFGRLAEICGRFSTVRDAIYNKQITSEYVLP